MPRRFRRRTSNGHSARIIRGTINWNIRSTRVHYCVQRHVCVDVTMDLEHVPDGIVDRRGDWRSDNRLVCRVEFLTGSN